MSNPIQGFGQSNVVRLSDEDATVALLENAVKGLWDVVNELTQKYADENNVQNEPID